jgi:hypothetical protein
MYFCRRNHVIPITYKNEYSPTKLHEEAKVYGPVLRRNV